MDIVNETPCEELNKQLENIQKQLEEVRQENQLLLEENQFIYNSFQNAPTPCVKLDTQGRIQNINESAARLLGLLVEKAKGESIFRFLTPVGAKKAVIHLKRSAPENNLFYQYIHHQIFNNCVRSYLWSNTVIFNKNGVADYIVCTCLPSELQDGIVQQLTKSNENNNYASDLNRRIMTTLLDIILENNVLGNHNILRLISEQFAAESSCIFRYQPEGAYFILEDFEQGKNSSIKGVRSGMSFQGVNPRYLKDYEQGMIRVSYRDEVPLENTLTEYLRDNNIDYQSTLSVPLVGDEGFWGLLIIVRERNMLHWMDSELSFIHLFAKVLMLNIGRIDTQKKLERQNSLIRLAIERSEVYVWEYDFSKDVFFNNEKVLERYGYPLGKQPVFQAQTFMELIHPDDIGLVLNAFQSIANLKDESIQVRVKIVHPEGDFYEWFEYRFCPLAEKREGTVNYVIGTATCIEKFKQEELHLIRLLKAKNEAEESNRLKSAFIANMSHEIRTPLNAIVGFSQILTETDNREDKEEFIGIIHNNTDLLLRLIDDLLDISRIEAGCTEFEYKIIDVNIFLDELAQSARLRLKGKDIKVSVQKGLPVCRMSMERSRVMQILMNFVNNAVKFTDYGSITLGYSLVSKGRDIRFYVKDTGCGIAKESQKKIFDRFVKLNEFVQGTGLGLSICETIVKIMNGKIGVESEPEKGSEFWFTLPYEPLS